MQVEDYARQEVEASEGFANNTVDFGVKNPAVIFDMLCNRMYRNAKQTMVQEYMSNARDAHREIGSDAAIEVTLPTSLHPYLAIRDYGPGLTPERMKDVFVFLGESTKRHSNEQTGGFGIGAKVGWAYGDSFTIVSITGAKKRTYLAFMGDNNVGKLSMTSEIDSIEANGVEIQIHINDGDKYDIEKAVNRVAYFWETQPTVHNRQYDYEAFKGVCEGAKLSKVPFAAHEPLAVVDGIPYPMDSNVEEVRKFSLIDGLVPCLFFKVGQIDLAVNRESMRYTDNTLASIEGITASIASRVEAASKNVAMTMSFDELVTESKNFTDKFSFLGTRYIELVPDLLKIELSGTTRKLHFLKPCHAQSYKFTRDYALISKVKSSQIGGGYRGTQAALSDTVYVYHGTGMPPKGKAAVLFETGHNSSITILCISNYATCSALWAAGVQNYNDLKDAPKLTAAAPAQGIRRLNSDTRIDIEDFDPAVHYYVNYKVKAEYEEIMNNVSLSGLRVVPIVPTLDQLPALKKRGIQHLDVALKLLWAQSAVKYQMSMQRPVSALNKADSVYELPDIARSMIEVYNVLEGDMLEDPLFEEFHNKCAEVTSAGKIQIGDYRRLAYAVGRKPRLISVVTAKKAALRKECVALAKQLKSEYPLLSCIDYNAGRYWGDAQIKQQQIIAEEVLFYINGKYKGC